MSLLKMATRYMLSQQHDGRGMVVTEPLDGRGCFQPSACETALHSLFSQPCFTTPGPPRQVSCCTSGLQTGNPPLNPQKLSQLAPMASLHALMVISLTSRSLAAAQASRRGFSPAAQATRARFSSASHAARASAAPAPARASLSCSTRSYVGQLRAKWSLLTRLLHEVRSERSVNKRCHALQSHMGVSLIVQEHLSASAQVRYSLAQVRACVMQ